VAFADAVTLTRSGPLALFNAAGLLTTYAADVPGKMFDQTAANRPLGLAIFEERQNLTVRSGAIDHGDWTRQRLASVTPNVAVGPTGASVMAKMVEDGTGGAHGITQAYATTSGVRYAASFFVRADTRTWVAIDPPDGAFTDAIAYFNVGAGSLGTVGAGCTATIVPAGTGIYRVTWAATATGTSGSQRIRLLMTTGNGTLTYTGDGTSGLYAWGGQFEVGTAAGPYIPTDDVAVTRGADIVARTDLAGVIDTANRTLAGLIVARAPAVLPPSGTFAVLSQVDDGTANNRVRAEITDAGAVRLVVTTAGVAQAAITAGTVAAGAAVRLAYRAADDDFAASLNGATAVADASGTAPSGLTTHRWGRSTTGEALNAAIARNELFVTATDAELEALAA
jgi:hypothetical protein